MPKFDGPKWNFEYELLENEWINVDWRIFSLSLPLFDLFGRKVPAIPPLNRKSNKIQKKNQENQENPKTVNVQYSGTVRSNFFDGTEPLRGEEDQQFLIVMTVRSLLQ